MNELNKYIVTTGKKIGASEVEVLSRSLRDVDVNIESGEISGVERKLMDEISIRTIVGKKTGNAFINIPTKEAADKALSMAIASARASTDDDNWMGFPQPSTYPLIEGLWNEGIATSDPSLVVNIAREFMEKAVEAEEGLIAAYGSSGLSIYHKAYANSNDISHAEKGNIAYAVLGAIAKIEGGVTPMILAYDVRRSLELDLDGAVDDITRMIRVCKNRTKGSSGKHTVVMHPWAYGQIFNYTLMQSIKGDNIARGKSKLEGKIGEEIASEHLTIIDDGTNPRGVNTSVADGEGVPRQKTPIIERGVLRSFLWDTYWGNKMDERSTGNASRSMRRGLVEIAPTNLVVEPGKRDINEIISEMDHGYLIRGVQGAHSSNPESGDFSVVGNPAILIEKGEMVGAIHGLMLSGNVFELSKKIIEISKQPLIIQNLIGPELIFEEVNVIASN
jgi:PmbA protein